jgi:hypothetical protein
LKRRDTNSTRAEDSGSPRQIVRFKVTGTVTDFGASVPRTDLVTAHRYNGTDEGTTDIIIAVAEGHAVGDELWAVMPEGGTALTYAKDSSHPAVPVLWLALSSKPSRAKFRITAVSGSFPEWTYTGQRVIGYNSSLTGAARWLTDGTDVTLKNRCEFASPDGDYPYTYGTGSTITASDGTVNSTACKIIPIGVGATPDVDADFDETGAVLLSFFAANSAE